MTDRIQAADARAMQLSQARLLEIIARELGTITTNESLSDRSNRLLWMIDGMLRNMIVAVEDSPVPKDHQANVGAAAVAQELAEIERTSAREAALSLASRPAALGEKLEIAPSALTDYLRSKGTISAAATVSKVEKLLGGFSKETFLVAIEGDASLTGAVLRRDVSMGPVDSYVRDEYPLLLALAEKGLPVARPIIFEPDPAIFGQPFILSERIAGTATPNTEGLGVKPEQIDAARALAAFLAQQHSQNIDTLGLGGRWDEPGLQLRDHIRWEIDQIDASWRDHRTTISPIIATALDWLRDNIPDTGTEPVRIVHGDAGLHNLLMKDGRMTVMLDWELAHPGDPTEDLSYCRTWVDQVLGWDEFLNIYYRHGGQPYHAERELFYGVLADLRVAVFAVRSEVHVRLSDQPELPVAFASVYYSRIFRSKVGARLLEVLE